MADPESQRQQLWLLQFENPLLTRFGKEFFSSIPKKPGVYLMKNNRGELIYVGKAKNLKNRIRSYTRVNAVNSSRKLLRLVHTVKVIEWELLPDEKSALLRENHLLRTCRPFFNVLNTSPHTYLFVHLRLEDRGIRFHLAMTLDESYPEIYGAFKGMGVVLRAQKAIFRLLWASFHECRHGFEFPSIFTNHKKLDHFLFQLSDSVEPKMKLSLYRDLKRFYNGSSKRLLAGLIERLLGREDLAPFMKGLIQQDIDSALEFYQRCSNRNRRMKRMLRIESKILPQEQLDDFLVEFHY